MQERYGKDAVAIYGGASLKPFPQEVRDILRSEKPDVIGCTAITPSIYKAERLLEIAKEEHPNAVTVLGGIHATFMYRQVLAEALVRFAEGSGAVLVAEGIETEEQLRYARETGFTNVQGARTSPLRRFL